MSKTENETKIIQRVLQLQVFYKQALLYAVVSVLSTLMWIILNQDYFWPIWVMLLGGGYLSVHAMKLGLIPLVEEIFPFMGSHWVDEEVQRRLSRQAIRTSNAAKPTEKSAEQVSEAKKQGPLHPETKKKSALPHNRAAVAKKVVKKPSLKK